MSHGHEWDPLPNQSHPYWLRCRRCRVRITEDDRRTAHSFEGLRPLGTCDEEVARRVLEM